MTVCSMVLHQAVFGELDCVFSSLGWCGQPHGPAHLQFLGQAVAKMGCFRGCRLVFTCRPLAGVGAGSPSPSPELYQGQQTLTMLLLA